MLTYYGTPIDGQAETALKTADGVIPDEQQMYLWIKAAFRHFFNNVQKDPQVQIDGLRACRLLLAYLLREIGIQRERLLSGQPVDDTMLTRLVLFQLGRSAPTVARPANLDPRLVSDLRIAENVMGTIVGAIAGQEEATCRVIDSLIRLQGGEYRTSGSGTVALRKLRRGDRSSPLNVLSGIDARESRRELYKYFLEALRLQPQGEVLLRKCATRWSAHRRQPADLRPARSSSPRTARRCGTFPSRTRSSSTGLASTTCSTDGVGIPASASTSRPSSSSRRWLPCSDFRICRGLSPAPASRPSRFERRFGRLQLDDQNLYATTFSLAVCGLRDDAAVLAAGSGQRR